MPCWVQGQTSWTQPYGSIPPRILIPPRIPPLPHWYSLNRYVWSEVQLVTSVWLVPPVQLCLIPAETWARRWESEEPCHSAGRCSVCGVGGSVASAQMPH